MTKLSKVILLVTALATSGVLAHGATLTSSTTSVSPAPSLTDTSGSCGKLAGGAGCADPLACCSKFGFCGVGSDTINNSPYCGDGCQGGPCLAGAIKLGSASGSTNATVTPTGSTAVNGTSTSPTGSPLQTSASGSSSTTTVRPSSTSSRSGGTATQSATGLPVVTPKSSDAGTLAPPVVSFTALVAFGVFSLL